MVRPGAVTLTILFSPHGTSVDNEASRASGMAVERVGAFLQEASAEHAGQTLVVIGHVATRYGLAFWSGSAPLEEIVAAPWEWRDAPISRYPLRPDASHRLSRPPGRASA